MKKLVLKKDVVARINNVAMNQLRGGAGTTYTGTSVMVCPSDECTKNGDSCDGTCKVHETCKGYETCDGKNVFYF